MSHYEIITQAEIDIEAAYQIQEKSGNYESALNIYRQVESVLLTLPLDTNHADHGYRQGILAYCYLRQSAVLEILERHEEAAITRQKEVEAARQSDYEVGVAQQLMEKAADALIEGNVEDGTALLDEAHFMLIGSDSPAAGHALGQCWLLRAETISRGLLNGGLSDALHSVNEALPLLLQTDSYQEIARAYSVRARINEALGNTDQAAADRGREAEYSEAGN